MLAFKPHLMGCSIEETWKPLVKYLYYHGISRDGMKRMLMVKPIIFCVNLETTIVPKVFPLLVILCMCLDIVLNPILLQRLSSTS